VTETRHYCDCCRERIHQDRTALEVTSGPLRLRTPTIDLCATCLGKLVALLSPARPAAAEAPPAVSNGVAVKCHQKRQLEV
jgi:hypothetical protein